MRVLSFIVFGAVVALVVPSMAKDKQIPEAILIFTDNYATALGLEAACPTWRVDRAKAASALAVSGLPDNAYEVPGPLHDRFMESGTRAKSLSPEMACDAAERLFGPDGTGIRGFMKKR
jgi:hypothetical protein